MSTLPLILPKARFFDDNGNPLSGGKLYAYAAGTSTPLDTYTTRAGNIANANPVILDANGEADVWTTTGVLYKFVLKTSADVIRWTEDNYPSGEQGTTVNSDLSSALDPGGRLTLTSATPVTTSDVTGATTVLYVPYTHNKVPLYDGTSWSLYTVSTELSQATSDATKSPAAVANSSMYDLFIWVDAGTLRLSRGPAWSSDTTRGTGAGTTELELVGGRNVNKNAISNGPAAQRGLYVGTIRSDGSAQIEDSLAKRRVWNAYNRVERAMAVTDATTSWSYTTNTWRQANNASANQLDFVLGLALDSVSAHVLAAVAATTTTTPPGTTVTSSLAGVGIGLDSSTVSSANVFHFHSAGDRVSAQYEGCPTKGRHTLRWLEFGQGDSYSAGGGAVVVTNSATWYGTYVATGTIGVADVATPYTQTVIQSGIFGHLFA